MTQFFNKLFIYRFSAWRKWSWTNTKRNKAVDLKETKTNSNICIRSWHISRSWFTILIRVVVQTKSYQSQLTTKVAAAGRIITKFCKPLASKLNDDDNDKKIKIFFELYIFCCYYTASKKGASKCRSKKSSCCSLKIWWHSEKKFIVMCVVLSWKSKIHPQKIINFPNLISPRKICCLMTPRKTTDKIRRIKKCAQKLRRKKLTLKFIQCITYYPLWRRKVSPKKKINWKDFSVL